MLSLMPKEPLDDERAAREFYCHIEERGAKREQRRSFRYASLILFRFSPVFSPFDISIDTLFLLMLYAIFDEIIAAITRRQQKIAHSSAAQPLTRLTVHRKAGARGFFDVFSDIDILPPFTHQLKLTGTLAFDY